MCKNHLAAKPFQFPLLCGMSRIICLFHSLSFFLLSLHEERCENVKKLVADGKFFLCLCELSSASLSFVSEL